MKNGLKKLKRKVKSVSKTIKSILITGDKGNRRIPYREKRAPMELRTVRQEHEKVKKLLKESRINPNKFSKKKLDTLKRRHLAASKKMSIADERKFYKSRVSRKDQAILAGATAANIGLSAASLPLGVTNPALGTATYVGGSIIQYGAPGLRAVAKYRSSVLDKRYDYMKKHGYIK